MKKYFFNLLALVLLISLVFVKCRRDERDINLNLSEVTNLFAPADNAAIKLNPAANLTTDFEWEQAKAEDGSLVLYEVAFDQAGGDFSNPFYSIVSNNRGVENKLTLTHGQLNQIAALGGAQFFEKKSFIWTVLASKGTNVKKATVTRTIELERPGGFDVLPGAVYLYGSATEGGDNLGSALRMKQLSPGVFEIFTRLKAGTYKFTDGTSGTPRQFYVFNNGGVSAIGINGETTFTGPDKIMRIRLNFNDINATYAEVKSVALWYAQGNEFWFTLPYVGKGVWRKNGYTVNLIQVAWGLEERYKYKMVYNDGTGDKDLWLNSNFGDPAGQDGQYPSSVAYRTINMEKNDGSQYDWGWKFDRNYLTQGSVADFWVSLNTDEAEYTQNYKKQ